VSTALVGQALSKVGFTEKTKSQMVSELSGGWRMRLAIAKAILENADLLMLVCSLSPFNIGRSHRCQSVIAPHCLCWQAALINAELGCLIAAYTLLIHQMNVIIADMD
jgi:ABC-type taurine transport system ATPase subunit